MARSPDLVLVLVRIRQVGLRVADWLLSLLVLGWWLLSSWLLPGRSLGTAFAWRFPAPDCCKLFLLFPSFSRALPPLLAKRSGGGDPVGAFDHASGLAVLEHATAAGADLPQLLSSLPLALLTWPRKPAQLSAEGRDRTSVFQTQIPMRL